MTVKFFENEKKIKIKLNQRHNREESVVDFVDSCIIDSNEKDLSTRSLQMRKSHLFDLQEHFEHYSNVVPDFGFNIANYDKNLIESYLLPILVDERNFELTLIG